MFKSCPGVAPCPSRVAVDHGGTGPPWTNCQQKKQSRKACLCLATRGMVGMASLTGLMHTAGFCCERGYPADCLEESHSASSQGPAWQVAPSSQSPSCSPCSWGRKRVSLPGCPCPPWVRTSGLSVRTGWGHFS